VRATVTTIRMEPIVMWTHFGRRVEESWLLTFIPSF